MTTFITDPNIQLTCPSELEKIHANPGFGKYFTDRMAVADWDETSGWHNGRICATKAWNFHPGAAVFHYGQEIFEGMKAYRRPDGKVQLFRPEQNAARFAASAERMSMPPIPEKDFLEAVFSLVKLESDWVPHQRSANQTESSLYLRPFMISTETLIGVRAALNYRFAVIATPANPFYSNPLTLWVSPNYSRSAAGGTGKAKCGGNYAGALIGETQARQNGCDQVLWLDSANASHIEECGTMNFLFVTSDKKLVTPALTGTILAGVTRDSLLKLAESEGLEAEEKTVTITELKTGIESGYIRECLACGTAAVVSPVVAIKAPDWQVQVGDGKPGGKTLSLRNRLTDIQFGRIPDPFNWTKLV